MAQPNRPIELTSANIRRTMRAQAIQEGLLFPDIYREFQRYASMSGDGAALKELQRERLEALLRHAMRSVPAYRKLGLNPTDIRDPFAALAAFPLVTKAELAANSLDHCDDDVEPTKCRILQTSGTTGIPLRIVRHVDALAHSWATALNRNTRYGLEFDRRILLPFQVWLDDWFEHTSPARGFARVAEFGGGRDDAARTGLLERAHQFRPDVLSGHPSSLLDFLTAIAGGRHRLPNLKAIVTYGELLAPAARQALGEFFAAPVYDLYGMKETSTIAVQCERGRYHIESERLWVEVVNPSGAPVADGQTGEIVVTDLINTAMPLVRYGTGDLGSLSGERCSCGLPHKVMSLVEGRNPGGVRRPDGTTVEVLRLARIIRGYPVLRYQVIQRDLTGVTVLVKPSATFVAAHAARITAELRASVGPDLSVSVELADDASFLAQGRRKAVDFVSLLPEAAGAPATLPEPTRAH